MATIITEPQSHYKLVSGEVAIVNIPPEDRRRTVPIRLYMYGATDPVDAGTTGVESYFITMRRSKTAADETILEPGSIPVEPSGLVALAVADTVYTTFTSGYESKPIGYVKVESSPYFINTTHAAGCSGTINPASGMIYPSGNFSYAPGYVYMFEYYEWEKDHFYWFYIGATDKAGNATKFNQMTAHGQNPWSGMIPSTDIGIPQEDTTPPSGMQFLDS